MRATMAQRRFAVIAIPDVMIAERSESKWGEAWQPSRAYRRRDA